MDVSIVIVNYNTKGLLSDCLRSVYDKTCGIAFEVIVVDNASVDGSESHIKKLFPYIRWISSSENLGFGNANNLGASYALGKYLFLLNSDTVLLNNAVKLFYEYVESEQIKHIGVLGTWLRNINGDICNSYGYFPTVKSEISYLLGKLKHTVSEQPHIKTVDYVIGADIFINKQLFLEAGGFDSQFFMYYEETELQLRLASLNWERRLITAPQIIHLEGGSFGKNTLTFSRFMMAQQSYNYYLKKHKHGWRYFCHKAILSIVRLTLFFETEWTWKERVEAYRLVLKK